MRLVTDRAEVLSRLRQAGGQGRPILCPNAETPDEMEGILLGAQQHARAAGAGAARVTVGIGFTAGYPDHPQLGRLALSGATLVGTARRWLYWLNGYANHPGLFDGIDVIPFLDHGWAPHDTDLALMNEPWFQDALGILMFDASAFALEENIRLTAGFAARVRDRVVIEACPDKVYEHAELLRKNLRESDLLSRPERVERFVRATGVDLIVPNLGTEHRAAGAAPLEYRRDLARDISRRVGPIQALHGTSSLGGRLGTVGGDGICKINYYTAMARAATTAVHAALSAAPKPLPIAQSCGSFIHRARREAIAQNIAATLAVLATAPQRPAA
jgi:fructose-bisphosphate aldolase class II